jgi:hypothetical protein
MTKLNVLSAALISAALLTTPATARDGQLTSQRPVANARASHSADGQACCRDCASGLRALADRDAWGHWGTYYGPMVVAP